jgi:TonB family protein
MISKALIVTAIACLAGVSYGQRSDLEDPLASSPPFTDADSSVETEPVLVDFVRADYPPALLKQGVEGTVTMTLLVSEQGRVDSVAVIGGVHPELDSAVARAAARFVFTPAQAGGRPVPVLITYEYHVRFEDVVAPVEQRVNFTGIVVERGTRTPVEGANVYLSYQDSTGDTALGMPFTFYLKKIGALDGQSFQDNAVATATDSLGRFSFKSLPSGTVKVVIAAPYCERFIDRVVVLRDMALDVIFRVDRLSYSDYEIVVYGKQERKEVSTRTLTVMEIQKLPGFSGDAIKVIQSMPGVARPTFVSGDIVVRGAPTWDSRFYLDGVLIPTLYHYGGLKSTYNSDALKSIDFYPGGFSSRFGSAVAGVVDLAGRNARRDRFHGYGDVNLIDASVMVEGPVGKKGGLLATVRRSHAGDLLNWAVQDAGIIDLPVSVAPYYYDFVVRGDAAVGRSNSLFCTLFGSRDALELVVPFFRGGSSEVDSLANRVQESSTFTMAIAGADSRIGDRFVNSARIAVNRDSGDASFLGFARFGYGGWEYTIRDELRWTHSRRYVFAAGLDFWWMDYCQRSVFPNADNTFQYDTLDSHFGLVAPYVFFEWRPAEKVLVVPGLRFDYYHELKHDGAVVPEFWHYTAFDNRRGISGEPSLRLSARYETAPGQTAKFSIGTYNQSPQPMGFVTHTSLGNPFLPATKARHIVGGYEWRITDLVSVDIQAYHNQQWDIPVQTSIEELMRDPSTPRFSPGGIARMYGMELLLRHDQGGRFFGWLAYSLSRSERYAGGTCWNVYGKDQPHNLQIVGSYRLPYEWQAGARLRFVSGNPETPVTGSVYDVTNGYYRPLYGAVNSSRVDPFFQTDMRIDKKFIFDKWMLSFYLDCQNIFFYLYASPEFTVYNYDFTQKTNISFPFIPSLGIRADF